MIAGVAPVIECREQSVPRLNEEEVAARDKRAAQLLAHSSLGEDLLNAIYDERFYLVAPPN